MFVPARSIVNLRKWIVVAVAILHGRTGGSERLLPARSRHSRRHRLRRPQRLLQDLRLGARSAGGVRGNHPTAPGFAVCATCSGSRSTAPPRPSMLRRSDCLAAARRFTTGWLRDAARIERALCPEERHRGAEERRAPPLLPEIAGPDMVEPSDPALKAALDHAFEEPADAAVPENQGGGRGA